MPRTLPAALTTAMDSGSYDPYLKVKLIIDDEGAALTVDVLAFKIEDMTAECVIPYDASYLGQLLFAIERGCIISGAPVTIRTMYYAIQSMVVSPMGIHIRGNVLPASLISIANAHIWYEDIINAFVWTAGWTWDQAIDFEDWGAAWKSYEFFPVGKSLNFANMQAFFGLMRQKYLIFFAENITGVFCFQATTTRAKDYDIVDDLLAYETVKTKRRLLWLDELNNPHYSGLTTSPIHNLGYIENIVAAPPTNVDSPAPFTSSKLPVHLKYRTGDVAKLGNASNYFQGRIKVTEVFDVKSNPSWHVLISPLVWFPPNNGSYYQAGAYHPGFPNVPPPSEWPNPNSTTGPWYPSSDGNFPIPGPDVLTGYFTGQLSAADQNMQAALETLDKHSHGLSAPIPNPTATSDFLAGLQVGSVWSWVKKTLAETLTILGKGVANGLATLGPNAAVPGSQLYHVADTLGLATQTNDEHFFALPAWTGWVNDPTGTNGIKTVSNHLGVFQADDVNLKSIYYRSITTYANKSIYMLAQCSYTSEVGIHVDDGTLNNSIELGIVNVDKSTCKIIKRVTTGGTPVVTDLATGLPIGMIGLYLFNSAGCYYFKDAYINIWLNNITGFFNTARIGFYFAKTATGAAKSVGITRFADNFV